MTVSNFVGLAEGTIDNAAFGLGRPYYTNSKWHRVIPEHVIQGGSPDIKGRAGTGYSYPNEIYDGLSHGKPGVLGIANAGASPTDDDIINAIFDERDNVNKYFASSTAKVKQSVANRFTYERQGALQMCGI